MRIQGSSVFWRSMCLLKSVLLTPHFHRFWPFRIHATTPRRNESKQLFPRFQSKNIFLTLCWSYLCLVAAMVAFSVPFLSAKSHETTFDFWLPMECLSTHEWHAFTFYFFHLWCQVPIVPVPSFWRFDFRVTTRLGARDSVLRDFARPLTLSAECHCQNGMTAYFSYDLRMGQSGSCGCQRGQSGIVRHYRTGPILKHLWLEQSRNFIFYPHWFLFFHTRHYLTVI